MISTIDPNYNIKFYRLGWYGGAGGRQVLATGQLPGSQQQLCSTIDTSTLLLECKWTTSYTLAVPYNAADDTDWGSGYYLAKLTGSSGKQSYIPFVVRDDNQSADFLMQAAVTTYQAYNNWGQETGTYPGKSLYVFNSSAGIKARKVSFNRPYIDGRGAGQLFAYEIRTLRFLEREGYSV
ncbi:MAG: hypothetical protein RL020_1005, partial [Pseudomonadota bacterium]